MQAGYGVWYRVEHNVASHVPPSERQSISRGGLMGVFQYAAVGATNCSPGLRVYI